MNFESNSSRHTNRKTINSQTIKDQNKSTVSVIFGLSLLKFTKSNYHDVANVSIAVHKENMYILTEKFEHSVVDKGNHTENSGLFGHFWTLLSSHVEGAL